MMVKKNLAKLYTMICPESVGKIVNQGLKDWRNNETQCCIKQEEMYLLHRWVSRRILCFGFFCDRERAESGEAFLPALLCKTASTAENCLFSPRGQCVCPCKPCTDLHRWGVSELRSEGPIAFSAEDLSVEYIVPLQSQPWVCPDRAILGNEHLPFLCCIYVLDAPGDAVVAPKHIGFRWIIMDAYNIV